MHFPQWHDEFAQFGRCHAELGLPNPRSFFDWLWKGQHAECQRHNHCREEKMPLPGSCSSHCLSAAEKAGKGRRARSGNPHLEERHKAKCGSGNR